MPNLKGPELLILILIVVLLFGAKRLPDAARSVGRSLRIFKAETKGLVDPEAPEGEVTAGPVVSVLPPAKAPEQVATQPAVPAEPATPIPPVQPHQT